MKEWKFVPCVLEERSHMIHVAKEQDNTSAMVDIATSHACCSVTSAKCPFGHTPGISVFFPQRVKLQLQAEERGVVSIKGVSANRFLAMKEDGRLLALKCATEECFFFERLESNNYNTYRSRKYSDWYVALKRTGQYKPGPKTGPGQKAILFLPMSAKS
ncbi:fibroblast growth factor 2 isoform X2 [Anas platyrhynchos]|uniref:fibroblast growth factor 2 isoform X2 n=1 Tax=Anas platyrhynchos TaxID=8839 RepID=UPI0018D6CFBE|nr:fibroblast growth factor 2 isoform X2 [Anas platyrhynchos]